MLRSASDERITLPVSTLPPAWSPDSSALAAIDERGIVVVQLDRAIRQLVWGCCSLRVDGWSDQGIVYVVGKYTDTNE